ncbi:hypothetical protein NLG97_g2077 [Lecanicillium saksenae]|uniref:Uncharacterized protein n=1 Tax=Lecanicillium saksenae TaxID=468837 RepID=A0ACC1R1X5_9HYPO|nr:hypothetical protein NLG97_g2077 [Lecanicillium saksenae]
MLFIDTIAAWFLVVLTYVARLRGSLIALQLQKLQRLPESTAKKLVSRSNISSDIDSIIAGMEEFISLPVMIMQVGIGSALLSWFLEAPTLIVYSPIVFSALTNYLIARYAVDSVLNWSKNAENRIASTALISQQLTAIKMLGLGPITCRFMQNLAKSESRAASHFQAIRFVQMVSVMLTEFGVPAAAIAVAYNSGFFKNETTIMKAFPVLSIIYILKNSFLDALNASSKFLYMAECFSRIEHFLKSRERRDYRLMRSRTLAIQSAAHVDRPIRFVYADIAPNGIQNPVLRGVNFALAQGSVTGVVGPAGAGKTLILQGILVDQLLYMEGLGTATLDSTYLRPPHVHRVAAALATLNTLNGNISAVVEKRQVRAMRRYLQSGNDPSGRIDDAEPDRDLGQLLVFVTNTIGLSTAIVYFLGMSSLSLSELLPEAFLRFGNVDPQSPAFLYPYASLSLSAAIFAPVASLVHHRFITTRLWLHFHRKIVQTTTQSTLAYFEMTNTAKLSKLYGEDTLFMAKDLPDMIFRFLYAITEWALIICFICINADYMVAFLPIVAFAVAAWILDAAVKALQRADLASDIPQRMFDFVRDASLETKESTVQLAQDWPSRGKIDLQDARAYYSPTDDDTPTFLDTTLSILPGEHIGIAGRSGSGKSSLLLALLGFIPYHGRITIDGIEVSSLAPDTLRSHIIMIPEEPVIFDGTIRANLLPFSMNEPNGVHDAQQDLQLELL